MRPLRHPRSRAVRGKQAPLPARHTPEDAAQHAARAATMQAAIADAESRRDACTVPVIERM